MRMRRHISALILIFLFLSPVSVLASRVDVITYDGVINPVAAEFMTKSIDRANTRNAQALIIRLDTPGGLDSSMRQIVKSILGSGVPVVVYVAPGGARAASAGVFITLSANVAAMAPETNIGAAHPVGLMGKVDKTMAQKVENDAAAYIKSIAQARGRNTQWAEDAVRKSISSTDTDALKLGVVDMISPNLDSLIKSLNGRRVETASGPRTIMTAGAPVAREEMSTRLRILSFISDPDVAYILMLLGFYGLFFEFINPGAIFPGVIGAISLILAFYSFQMLPVNYAGLMLIVLAIILFVLEIKVTSHGVLTIGGMISMIIGSLMLFSGGPYIRLSFSFILPAVFMTALFFAFTIRLALKAQRRKPITGPEGLKGEEGIASTDITGEGGTALLHGEVWSVYSDQPIKKGEKIIVETRKGLSLKVRGKEKNGGGEAHA